MRAQAEDAQRSAFLGEYTARIDEELGLLRETVADWEALPAHREASWRTVNGMTFQETLAAFRKNRGLRRHRAGAVAGGAVAE